MEYSAEGIVLAAGRHDEADPVNLGAGFDGTIEWDMSKPDGQPRRRLDTGRAREELKKTIDWYRDERRKGIARP